MIVRLLLHRDKLYAGATKLTHFRGNTTDFSGSDMTSGLWGLSRGRWGLGECTLTPTPALLVASVPCGFDTSSAKVKLWSRIVANQCAAAAIASENGSPSVIWE